MTENKNTEGTPSTVELDDVMIAMDVVDTLRHDEKLVDRELNAKGRREKLIKRLRNLYKGQGIDVPDHLLIEGVQALEDGRFSYNPPKKGWAVWLARIYIARARVGLFIAAAFVAFAAWLWSVSGPIEIEKIFKKVEGESRNAVITEQARALSLAGLKAHRAGNKKLVEANTKKLSTMLATLRESYVLRIVTRKGVRSGVWRIPKVNKQSKNYYLIVEAVSASGTKLRQMIRSEETGEMKLVKIWGIRVDKSVFDAVKQDKLDDGIIQNAVVGEKLRGFLKVKYKIAEPSGSITKW